MIEIRDRLFIGTDSDCRRGNEEWAIVHACKSPCHQRAVGYKGSLPQSHPNYLVLEAGNDLYLNIIDPPKPLFTPPLFVDFLSFAANQWREDKKILIHCNQGESRAPSLALLFMSKFLHEIPRSSYIEGRREFEKLFRGYRPGTGIQTYLSNNWDKF